MPSPNFHVTSRVNNHNFLGSAESACLENATPNQIMGHEVVRGVAMVSEVVATSRH